jgi:hypothetical protein
MGVKNAGRFMHHSPPLKSEEFIIGLSLFANYLGISGQVPIAIDASWVGHSYHTSKKAAGMTDSSQHLADLCRTLASLGFAVTVVLDGKQRHHSKRASVQRKAKATKACIKARTLHSQILLLSSKIEDTENATISPDERIRLLEERKSLAAQLTSAERYSLPFNSSDFEKKTIDLLLGDKEFGKGSIRVIRAAYQADSVIAQGLLNQNYAIVFGNDSDFSFLSLGCCIQVTKFTLKKQSRSGDGSLFQLCNVTLSSINRDLIANFLANLPGSHLYTVIPAKEDMTKFLVNLGPKSMSLIAVCLGCDQVSKGLPGFGVSRAISILNRIQAQQEQQPCPPAPFNANAEMTGLQTIKEADEQVYKSMIVLLKEKDYGGKVSECYWECIETSCMAFMFEPCNTVSYIGDTLAHRHPITYVHSSPPVVLPRYLHEFACGQEEIAIVDGPCLSECVGPGDGPHLFMDSEMCYDCQGTKTDKNGTVVCQMVHCRKLCSKCFRSICLDCRETRGNLNLCLECHGVEAVVPTPQEATKAVMMAQIPMNQLRAELALAGFDVSKEATRIELMELHEELVAQRKLSLYDMQLVKYPLFSSETLDFPSSRFESILEFDFKDGGRFIRDDRLDSSVVVELFDLLSRYVEFSSGKVATKKEYEVHHILPDIIIKLAEGSRLDCGYRLLQRCVRHSSDSKMPSIEDSTCRVVRVTMQDNDNNVLTPEIAKPYFTGLMISTKVPPSFKTEAPYGVQVLICSEGIAACRCSCKAGSHGCNRHVDVHILPVLYQLTLFLIECLSEHLLYELGQWIKDSGRCLPKDHEQLLHAAVTKLWKACKTPTANHESFDRNSTSKLTTMLEMFAVGTEQARRGCPPPPDRRDLRPLRQCTFENPVTKFKQRLNAPKGEESWNSLLAATNMLMLPMDTDDTRNLLDQQEPDYVGLHFILEELVRRMHVISPERAFNRMPFVGYQLLDLRRIRFCKDNNVDETKELVRACTTVDSILEVGCAERVALARGRVGRPPLVNVTTKKCSQQNKRVTNLNVVSTRSTEKAIEKNMKKALARGDRSKYCCVPACRTRHNRNKRVLSGDIKMYYLPLLKKKPTDGAREKVWYNYAMSLGLRKELKQRGFRLESAVTRYICCTDHELEEVKRSTTITIVGRKNKEETKRTFNFSLRVPKTSETSKAFTNAPSTASRGLGTDRALERIGKQLHQSMVSLSPGDKRDALLSRLEIQKLVELSDSNGIDCLINKRVRNSFGLTDADNQREEQERTSTEKKREYAFCL